MMCSLLLLYANDAESSKNDFLEELKGVPIDCIRIDDDLFFPLDLEKSKKFERSRRQVVFLSPHFLNTLKCSKTFKEICTIKKLNPLISIALFCCGLQRSDVKGYPTAFLPFYSRWPKFQVKRIGSKSSFPNFLLEYILAEFPTENMATRNIIDIPDLVKDPEAILGGLLLLYASDAESVKDDFLKQMRGVKFNSIRIEDHNLDLFHSLKKFTTARRQIVFLSRGYLDCIQGKLSFSYLNPLIATGLLCCGLRESDFMLYCHDLRVEFCDIWPRFQVIQESERSVFPISTMQFLRSEFPSENLMNGNIIVMPERISKEQSQVCVIFPCAIPNWEDISVRISNDKNIKIYPEVVNPYVIQFHIPAVVFRNYENFYIQILQSEIVIAEEMLWIVEDYIYHKITTGLNSDCPEVSNIEISVDLKEEELVSSDVGSILYDNINCATAEGQIKQYDRKKSWKYLCEKYGWELGPLSLSKNCSYTDITNRELLANYDLEMDGLITSQGCSYSMMDQSKAERNPVKPDPHRPSAILKPIPPPRPPILSMSNGGEADEEESKEPGECLDSSHYLTLDEIKRFCPTEIPLHACPVTLAHGCGKQQSNNVTSYVTSTFKAENATTSDSEEALSSYNKQEEIEITKQQMSPNSFLDPKRKVAPEPIYLEILK